MYNVYENLPSLKEILQANEEGRVNVSRHDDYLVCKYSQKTVNSKDWDRITLNSRGTIYDERTGELVFLPFPKFFNYRENELQASYLPASGISGAEILEKLDGSLGAIWQDREGEIRVSTPGSLISEQAVWATSWLRNHEKYNEIKESFSSNSIIGMVGEILYPGSKVVVNYDYQKVKGIKITAAQVFRSGGNIQYCNHEELNCISKKFNLATCDIYNFNEIDEIINYLKIAENFEGFILHWPNSGFRLKMKSDEYIRIHRTISRIHPNRIEEVILSQKAIKSKSFNDILQLIEECINQFPEEHRKPYEEACYLMNIESKKIQKDIEKGISLIKKNKDGLSKQAYKKACAAEILNGSAGIDKKYSYIAFSMLDGNVPNYSKAMLKVWSEIKKQIKFI